MKQILGNNNEITLCYSNGLQENCLSSDNAKWRALINESNIVIEGDANHITLNIENEDEAKALFENKAFNVFIAGNKNRINIGKGLIAGCRPSVGMIGLHLWFGTPCDHWTAPNTSRAVNNCSMDIGEHVVAWGAIIYLQEDGSSIRIGRDCMISWGVDIWNTDAHAIIDLNGEVQNYGRFIEIGNHVWIGRNVKIGKNVRIADDSIIGWGSNVTKSFEESHVVIAGTPAKIVKRGVSWDGRSVSEYDRFMDAENG